MSASVRIPTILRSYTGGANEVTIELPTTMLASMAANTNADLQVQVPMGMVTIPHNALSAIASAATS